MRLQVPGNGKGSLEPAVLPLVCYHRGKTARMGEVVQQNWDFRNWKARANTQSRGNEVLLNGNLAVLNAIKACLLFFFFSPWKQL